MLMYLKDGRSFVFTTDEEITTQYENGLAFKTIVARLASSNRISKTAAKQRVFRAVLRYQLPQYTRCPHGSYDPFTD